MGIADFARSAEIRLHRRRQQRKHSNGWEPVLKPYRGYGTTTHAHVLGRVLLEDPRVEREVERGYRQFITAPMEGLPVTVHIGEVTQVAETTHDGYFDIYAEDHGLAPGWHEAVVEAEGAQPTKAEVLITSDDEAFGIISDIDDTIMVTDLPRAFHAAYNSWIEFTDKRRPVDGMAEFYTEILRDHPDAPVFYLSTGAWNTYDTLIDFIEQQGLPKGPLLLTDWGPTPTRLFRSGQEHKRVSLRNLIITFPQIKWILVGDNGQHDPLTYGDLAAEHPTRVAGIAIRKLTPTEHVLAHGTVSSLTGSVRPTNANIPVISASDGFGLLRAYRINPFI